MTVLTNDSLLAVADRLRLQTLPVVLAVAPEQDSYDELAAAQRRAETDLVRAGIVDAEGGVDPEIAAALLALHRPDRELVARIYTGREQIRVCLVRRGAGHALAVRRGDTYDIRAIWADGSGHSLARPVLDALGPCPPADVTAFSAPTQDISERFDTATTSTDYAEAMYGLGAAERDAIVYGLALSSCHSYAEVVAYAGTDGVAVRSPGAVAVYDTAHGRLVAAPTLAPDQRLWSTITPGSDHRIAQAISALIESLPGRGWMPQ